MGPSTLVQEIEARLDKVEQNLIKRLEAMTQGPEFREFRRSNLN
jgi:hypothetical protein